MERGGRRSGEPPVVLIKKRSSSGCLIVKKSDGVGRICSFSESRPNLEPWLDRKRSKIIKSDSDESSDSVEQNTRHYRNVEESRFGLKRDWVEGKGDYFVGKRNSLDDHDDDDEEDDDDDKESEDELLAMRKRRSYDGSGVDIGKKAYLGSAQFGIDRDHGTGSSSKDLGFEKRRKPYLDGSGNIGFANQGYRNRCKVSGNESKTHALSSQKQYKRDMNFDGPIRVKGKNGVLKVMPKKQNKMGGLPQSFTDVEAKQTQYGSKIQETGKIRVAIQSPTTVKTENMAKLLPPARIQSSGLKMATSLTMKSKSHDQDSEDSDTSGRLQKRAIQAHKLLQMSSTGREQTLPEAPTPQKIRDGKIRRGSGTEKQRLRERIREMLLEAGWTIDYRPRRNRDYLDAVYISPRGTAFWSIIKAYEALLKQVNSGEKVAKLCEDSSAITSISDEILSQLTRKTKRTFSFGW
uniref:DUF7028 domain-containing protein n=1 Tax=Noccaea caerulescens TaxID=107243 RepID=A0A1J3I4Y1_NOCCA